MLKKNKMMIFHYRQKNITHLIPKLKINGIPIEHVKEFNFLGIILDECMTWEAHINKISCKIARTVGAMKRLKRFIPSYILKTLYTTLVLPYINYGILTWGHKIKRVNKLQKWALRTITNSKYNAHTEPICKQLKLLPIRDIFQLASLKMYHKFTNDKLPTYFDNIFDPIEITHTYDTRNRDDPQHETSNTKSADFSIRFSVPAILKKTAKPIIEKLKDSSISNFSKFTKLFFLSTYKETCNKKPCYVCDYISDDEEV